MWKKIASDRLVPKGRASTQSMRRDRLLDLYGPRLGERTAVELDGLLAGSGRAHGPEPGRRTGADNDALATITYGDTLRGADLGTPLSASR